MFFNLGKLSRYIYIYIYILGKFFDVGKIVEYIRLSGLGRAASLGKGKTLKS